MLSPFSPIWLFVTLCTTAQQAPLSILLWEPMGFSRQEYWSGLPCPPPGDLPYSGIEPRSPALQAYSLLSEPLGNPKNTGVGSLFLLQGIFPTQELNQGLLHCRFFTSWATREGPHQHIDTLSSETGFVEILKRSKDKALGHFQINRLNWWEDATSLWRIARCTGSSGSQGKSEEL